MLDHLEALEALEKYKTITAAGTALRLTQSAVSKRLASLETYYGKKLIEKRGRLVILTEAGRILIAKGTPLMRELKELLKHPEPKAQKHLTIGVSESILSSWGAEFLTSRGIRLGIELIFHTHRSPVVVDKVASGDYDLGVCAGKVNQASGLITKPIRNEEMVVIPMGKSAHKPRFRENFPIISIERSSATWKAIAEQTKAQSLRITHEVESFFAVAQLSKAGFGHGLVPIGVAQTFGYNSSQVLSFKPKISRPIQYVYKKSRGQSEPLLLFLTETYE